MGFIQMMLAFVILYGVSLLFYSTLRTNMGESMILSASAVVLLLFLSSRAGTFTYGMYAILAVSAIGGVLWCIKVIRNRGAALAFSPTFIILALIYIGSWIVLYNDFIQHVDEFHQWAAAVKYMLERDMLPTGSDFVGGGGQYGFATSLFHLFFQKITGYNEQNMYVSAALLSWIGFLLPMSEHTGKSWKIVTIYSAVLYIALYSLYIYGTKSLYVDIPVAAWAGGLAAWWVYRKKKRSNILVVASGLVMLHFFKQSAGLLAAVLVVLFMATHTFFIEKEQVYKKNGIKWVTWVTGVLCGLVLLGSVLLYTAACKIGPAGTDAEIVMEQQTENEEPWTLAGISLPTGLANLFEIVQVSQEKAQKTLGSFLRDVFGAPMSLRSNLKLGFIPFVFIVLFLFKLSGDLFEKEKESRVCICYSIFAAAAYSAAVYFSYVFMFAYELSVNLKSGIRYFSICAVYLFVIALAGFCRSEQVKHVKARQYACWGLLLFFVIGLNKSYVPNATALDKKSISGFEKISNTMHQTALLKMILGENDRVYFISQYSNLTDVELISASAYYYLETQISNYLAEPWKFYEGGCNIRLENFAHLTIDNLPDLLAEGGYTYVWINKSDKYLKNNLPEVMKCEEVGDGYLYKVIYKEGEAVGLEFVRILEELPEE